MKALVYKSTGSWYIVKDESGKTYNARIKGIFKIDDITSTNPVSVGDIVEMDMENESENTAIITGIAQRRNYINRQSPRGKHQHHIIAANLDQSMLVATGIGLAVTAEEKALQHFYIILVCANVQ